MRRAAVAAALAVPPALLSGCAANVPLPSLRPSPSQAEPHDRGLSRAVGFSEDAHGEDAHLRVTRGFVGCPAGYTAHEGPVVEALPVGARRGVAACGVRCDSAAECKGFRYSPSEDRCVVLHHAESPDGLARDYQFCEKRLLRHFHGSEAALYAPDEYVEQTGAEIEVGGAIGLYAVGSSSLVWMTWLDQLHLALRRLGYHLPTVPAPNAGGRLYPKQVPSCPDSKYFEYLQTRRFGRIGWNSWDFAFEGWEGCENGFRDIEGRKVKCQHGAGCAFSKQPVLASAIAADAARSNVTIVATWFNDDQQWSSHYKCFGGDKLGTHEVAPLTIAGLQRTVRSIHEKNPHTWVLIMGKYPQTYRHITYDFIKIYNHRVKEAIEKEPRTLFVDFYMPNQDEGQFFQVAHSGHPNCRGSKIMAYAVLDKLYQAGVLARSIQMSGYGKKDVLNKGCQELSRAACHASAFCWVDPADRACKTYSAGSWNYHTVCKGTVCDGPGAPHFV